MYFLSKTLLTNRHVIILPTKRFVNLFFFCDKSILYLYNLLFVLQINYIKSIHEVLIIFEIVFVLFIIIYNNTNIITLFCIVHLQSLTWLLFKSIFNNSCQNVKTCKKQLESMLWLFETVLTVWDQCQNKLFPRFKRFQLLTSI